MSAAKKEVTSRIWWAHYSFERFVSGLIGRPSMGMDFLCSVPVPLPLAFEDIEESILQSKSGDSGKRPLTPLGITNSSQVVDSSVQQHDTCYASGAAANSGSYLKSIVKLGEITKTALELYSANNLGESWEFIQRTIAHHNDKLDAWATAIPGSLNFFQKSSPAGHRYSREQSTLDMWYHSTKMLITRPCLCRLDRWITNQTTSSNLFNRNAALICIEAAQAISNLLPAAESNNIVKLYESGPWWQMIHVIMQALVVLCLEIVLQARHVLEDRQGLIPSLKKLIQWLRIMRVSNNMAIRAYALSVGLLRS